VGLPLVCVVSQIELYRDWPRRILALPFLLSLGCGLAVNNTWAFLQGLAGIQSEFVRTPKLRAASQLVRIEPVSYRPRLDVTVLGEIGLAIFTVFLMNKAQARLGYSALPYLVLYVLGFMYVAAGSLWTWPQRALAALRASGKTD
jgi:hypothetical protein